MYPSLSKGTIGYLHKSSILDAFCDIEEEEEEFKFSLKFRVFDFLVSLDLNLRFLTFW